MTYGSWNNLMHAKTTGVEPEVGMGVTVVYWTDRQAATVIAVETFKSGARAGQAKAVTVQLDNAIRTDNNGMSDAQSYTFTANPNGRMYRATIRKDGTFRVVNSATVVAIGHRSNYYDYSF